MPEFLGLPCVELRNEVVSLLVAATIGPRILSMRFRGGENLFAEVADIALESPAGSCRLWGGHRLWVAPEAPATTYAPDDGPVSIASIPRGLRVTAPPAAGFRKSLDVFFLEGASHDHPLVFVEHTITNVGTAPVSCAPWAITMFKPGGFAGLLHPRLPQDEAGLLPDRRFTIWPYTDVRSPSIEWGNERTVVRANLASGALKLGFPGGILSYFRNGTVFTKVCHPVPASLASSSECYCNPRFLELETVAPVATLPPGGSATHRELWSVAADDGEDR